MDSFKYDVAVIGGGAAGLMACSSAIRRGKRVVLVEKNNKLGVKILMSGGTRCNVTHDCSSREIVAAFGKEGKFLHSALAALSPQDVVRFIEKLGVKTKVEAGGKIFPVSDKAIDVRDALVNLANDQHAPGTTEIVLGQSCQNIVQSNGAFEISTSRTDLVANSVIITTGGMSYPGCGTQGDGYKWASNFGHHIVDPVPALTPVILRDHWSNQLKGITFESVKVSVKNRKSNKLATSRLGGFLFTHFGFSGPSVLDISKVISRYPAPDDYVLECDFQPDQNEDEVREDLKRQLERNPRQTILKALTDFQPRRFWECSLDAISIPQRVKSAELSKKQLSAIVNHLKRCRFIMDGVYGFKKAEVTAGGVDLSSIDSRTMQSKYVPGLYFAGEILNLDGPIGGYNFQAAFSTGWLAGNHA